MATKPLTLRALGRATLARQLLLERAKLRTAPALERLYGLQAQAARPPFLALWSRVEGFRREDLLEAIAARKVVRATLMRATLHLVTARDYLGLRGPLSPALEGAMRSVLRARADGLDLPAVLAEARAFFAGEPATFEAARDHLAARFPGADVRAMGYAVRTHLALVQVPTDDPWGFPPSPAFALAEAWLGQPVPEGGSPAELVRRYLAAYGPATAADVAAWSGLTGVRGVLDELLPTLRVLRDEEGRQLLDLPRAPRPDEDAPAPPRLLPEFDSLVLAHADRRRLIDDEHRAAVVTKNLQVRATFLVDGRVAGTWKLERKARGATLTLEPFAALSKPARKALEAEADRLLAFAEPEAKTRAVRFAS